MNFKNNIKSSARSLFYSPFKVLRGKPRLFAFSMISRVRDYLFGQNNYYWESNGEQFFLQCLSTIKPSGYVFDVGAHHGDWARIALSLKTHWNLYCFEPNPPSYTRLETAGLQSDRCNIYNFGFSNEAGQHELINYRVSDSEGGFVSSPMSSMFIRQSIMISESFIVESKVPIILETIDKFCYQQKIDEITLLKIDTEGNEFQVLLGAKSMIENRKITAIQFEYDASWVDSRTFLFDAWKYLRGNGYSIYKIAPEGLIEISTYLPALENFNFSNFVALLDSCQWPHKYVCMVI